MAEEKTANMIKTNTREKEVDSFFEGIDNKFDDKTSRKHGNGDFLGQGKRFKKKRKQNQN